MIDFVNKRIICLCISCFVFILGIVFFLVWGVTMDVQFEGGTLIQIETVNSDFLPETAEGFVQSVINKHATVQVLKTMNPDDNNNTINLIQIKIAKSEGLLTTEETNTLLNELIEDPRFEIKEGTEIELQSIEPSIGNEVRNRGFLAVAISLALIIVYVAFRFRLVSGISMGVIGVIGLLHDALVMFSVYIIFRIPLNESFIAGVLTILGYSINSTIIIYDRIRENNQYKRKSNIKELVNTSISQTMTRTIFTTLTSLIAVGSIYIFAVVYNISSIKEFSFPIMIGMISGAYSSVMIAPTWWAWWQEKQEMASKKPAQAAE